MRLDLLYDLYLYLEVADVIEGVDRGHKDGPEKYGDVLFTDQSVIET